MLKMIIAIVVGFVLWGILWVGSNALLAGLMPEALPSNAPITNVGALVLLLVISVLITILTGYIAARIAPGNGLRLGISFGIVLLLFGAFVQAQSWNMMPIWYHIPFLALLIPSAMVGVTRYKNVWATKI